MRITILGGSGLIGQALAGELIAHGHTVTILSRRLHVAVAGEVILWQQWDGLDSVRLQELLNGQEAIVNFAGESIGKGRWTQQRKEVLLQSRLLPTQAIVEALSAMPEHPALLVQASAIGYYGSGEAIKDETSEPGTDFLSQLAVQWEAASQPVEALGVRRVTVRTGIVLSKAGGVLGQLTLPFKLFVGGPIGSGAQWLSWIHMEDEVRAIRTLLESQTSQGVYNLTAPQAVTNAQMGRALATRLHRPYWLPLPGFVLRLVLGEMSQLVLEGQRVTPTRLLKTSFEFKFPTLDAALKDLLS